MEAMTTPLKIQEEPCANWPKSEDPQWLSDITSNLLLASAFSISYFVEESWTWIRILLILGHAFAANVSIARCQVTAFIWAVLLIGVNLYRLCKTAYSHRPTQIPRLLQDIYQNVFKDFNITRPEFAMIIEKSKIQGIGPEEVLYEEGHLRHDHVDLCMLVSGKMTVWVDGLPVHTIYPSQFVNSVEWASVTKLQESLHDFGWEQQVVVRPDEDSVYLRVSTKMILMPSCFSSIFLQIYGDHLEWLKEHKPRLWYLLEGIVCQDVTKKLYQMNEGFERMMEQRERQKRKTLSRLIVKSVSLEALHISSRGWNVSDNWLSADNRNLILGCPHTLDGMPSKGHILQRSHSYANLLEFDRPVNSNVAYLLRNSHPELVKNYEKHATVVPSLRMQALKINPLSCRFRDETIIRHYDWNQSWEHCGNCAVCKPLPEGEAQQAHPTVKG